ncbi:MAG: OsmC family protein [Xenococcaceae cyanobacterium]
MATVYTVYDGQQHCTAVKEAQNKRVALSCPSTGKSEEFSPIELVGSGLAGCMLLLMGAFAMRHDIDLTGTRIEVAIEITDKPIKRFNSIDIGVFVNAGVAPEHRPMLEKAAEACPIKHSFGNDIPIVIKYKYIGE